MGTLNYKGYIGSVEYSNEDNCLFGKILGINKVLIVYEGQTIDELRKDFEQGVNSYIATCLANVVSPKKSFSGSLNLRIAPVVHSNLAYIAHDMDVSINSGIKSVLTDYSRL